MNAQIAQQQSIANMLEVGGTALGNIDFSSNNNDDYSDVIGHFEAINPRTGKPYESYEEYQIDFPTGG